MRFDDSLIVTAQTTSPCNSVADSRAEIGIFGPVAASAFILTGVEMGLPLESVVVNTEYP